MDSDPLEYLSGASGWSSGVGVLLIRSEVRALDSFMCLQKYYPRQEVKVLDEASKNTVEENQSMLTSVYELESRLQAVEAKIFLSEVSITKEVPENKVMDHQTDLTDSLLHNQTTDFTNLISNKGNKLIANRGLNSSVTLHRITIVISTTVLALPILVIIQTKTKLRRNFQKQPAVVLAGALFMRMRTKDLINQE